MFILFLYHMQYNVVTFLFVCLLNLLPCRCPAVRSRNMDPVRGQDGKADPGKEDEATRVRVDGSDRLRVLEAVGFTSGTFIGPALPPSRTGPDIEETLSEFYKELQDLDTLDGADDNSGRPGSPSPPPSASVVFLPLQPPEIASVQWKCDPVQEWTRRPPEAELCLHGDERKQSPWPHWYNNEPYQQRRPRSNLHPDPERVATTPQQWRQRQSVGRPRPPPPRSLRPRFHRPPPPAAVPYSQSPPPPLPPRMDQDWGASVGTNPYEEEPGFLAFPHTPPPSFHSHPSVRPHVDSRCYFNQHQQDYYDYDDAPSSSSSGGGWAPGENEGRYQWAVEPDPRDQRCPPAHEDSALVLILLRGLPGSGKSTLARYVSDDLHGLGLRFTEFY